MRNNAKIIQMTLLESGHSGLLHLFGVAGMKNILQVGRV